MLFARAQSSRTSRVVGWSHIARGDCDRLVRELEAAADAQPPEQAATVALGLFVRASGAAAGALLSYDPHDEALTLLAEQGLAPEGRRRLLRIMEGDPAAWEMPLHGLLCRRAYLIENPSRNRYVPRLVDYPDTVRSIACLPLCHGALPVGAMVLVARAPGLLTERDVHFLAPALWRLGRLVDRWGRALRQQRDVAAGVTGAVSASCVVGAGAPAGLVTTVAREVSAAAVAAVLEEAGRATRAAAEADSRARTLAAELSEVQRERSEAQASAERLRSELDKLRCQVAAREQELTPLRGLAGEAQRLRSEVAALREEVAARQQESRTLRESLAKAEKLGAELDALREQASLRNDELCALRARVAATEELRSQLAELRRELNARREEAAALRSASAAAEQFRGEVEALRREVAVREAEIAELRSRAGHADDLGCELEALRRELRVREEELRVLRPRVAEGEQLRGEVASLRGEIAERDRELHELRLQLAAAEQLGPEIEVLRQQLEAAQSRAEEAEQLRREVDALREEARAREEVIAELCSRANRAEQIESELEAACRKLAAQEEELEAARSQAEETSSLRSEVETLRRELATRAAGVSTGHLQGVEPQDGQGVTGAEVLVAGGSAGNPQPLEAQPEPLPVFLPARSADDGGRAGTQAPPSAASQETPAAVCCEVAGSGGGSGAEAAEPLLILDSDASAWAEAGALEHDARLLTLGPRSLAAVCDLRPQRLLLNLGAPLALAALAALRCSERGVMLPPVLGCIVLPGGKRGLLLGEVELLRKPLAAAGVFELIAERNLGRVRVLTLGSDVEAMLAVRRGLAGHGLSVSMAWDAKQMAGLLEVVRPDVAVVDLELGRHDGLRALAAAAAQVHRPRLTILVSNGPSLPAEGVRIALATVGANRTLLGLRELVGAALAVDRAVGPGTLRCPAGQAAAVAA